MAGLKETLGALRALKVALPVQSAGRVREVAFAPNPGNLRAMAYVPAGLQRNAPLVVALHGCTQNAAAYDNGAGWSTLADRAGFAVLCPEQVRANNQNNCFNWFEPGDIARGAGEVASIAAMVTRMTADFGLDRRRVFVTGLSAGGAMTAALLACYPDIFAGGAIVAGLPFGVANSVQSAMMAMHRVQPEPARALGDRVRAASSHRGPWPRVSIWHGTADHTVRPENADCLVEQWTDVQGLSGPGESMAIQGASRRVWLDGSGRIGVELVMVPGLGHGVPISPASGVGTPAAHIIATGVSSTEHIAQFFGLIEAVSPVAHRVLPPEPETALAKVLRLTKLPGMRSVGQD